MTNLEDDVEGLHRALEQHFSQSSVEVIGSEALFWATDSGEAFADPAKGHERKDGQDEP
jgi:hypothetical protein